MAQAKFTLEQSHIDFLDQFKDRGFKDKSTIVRLALDRRLSRQYGVNGVKCSDSGILAPSQIWIFT
jgi:hypothetical protein